MIVRELVGGIYFGQPRVKVHTCQYLLIWRKAVLSPLASVTCSMLQGFKTNDKGEKVGFNTMIYSESEVMHAQLLKLPLCR